MMKNLFAKAITQEYNKTTTEKGGNAYKSTNDELLDLFSNIGSLRNRDASEIEDKFERAYDEDPLLATKMLFYSRNVRGGLGERRTAKILLKWLANNHPQTLVRNLTYVPHFGRWDDLYSLVGTPVEPYVWTTIAYQFIEDLKHLNQGKNVSLMAKWLKSANASSSESKRLGRLTAEKLGITQKEYRQSLTKLRAKIKIVETKMSANKWEDIEFSIVPSKAMMNYRNAFEYHQPERFKEYKELLESGETKINAGTLYPYEIIERADLVCGWWHENFKLANSDAVLEAQWKALPNYVTEPVNFLVMADTSGSMHGRPMATSLGLAIYFAERNTGDFHNQFMTFSSEPRFVELKGKTLADKVNCIESIVDSTNLEKAFEEILNLAIDKAIPREDMPKSLIVISDGEIDKFSHDRRKWDFLSNMRAKFNDEGYKLPKVVMWNVESRADRFIDTIQNPDIQFISGSSPSSFKALIEGRNFTAQELMLEVLNDPMYEMITL